jgi:hypothetical protein
VRHEQSRDQLHPFSDFDPREARRGGQQQQSCLADDFLAADGSRGVVPVRVTVGGHDADGPFGKLESATKPTD